MSRDPHSQPRSEARTLWAIVFDEVARSIHGDERDFGKEPLNPGERMTVRQRATALWWKRMNREQRRAVGWRGNKYVAPTMAARISRPS